tara:strand:- start:8844 stop:9110 length:267 start_codon:yes stop_codon:yes gene_type:complete
MLYFILCADFENPENESKDMIPILLESISFINKNIISYKNTEDCMHENLISQRLEKTSREIRMTCGNNCPEIKQSKGITLAKIQTGLF